ncbi:hypothetical protein JHD46_05230 [Sulfurimonas sp. SAG-AH-194-C20]|nr:hypothetical protein [Sulfurimonas sp. SAG-AH-194-C20]MDF1879041.1 hypothetical protein [Sulfurimonas sp. SAG-AH-194-C20]
MSTILQKIKSESSRKKVKLSVQIDSELKSKIDFICKNNDVSINLYVEKLLENSEISRTYNETLKAIKKAETTTLNDDINSEKMQ